MEKVLTAKDICSIVKACASSGVREITLGDILIKFGSAPLDEPKPNIHYEIAPQILGSLSFNSSQELDDEEDAKERELDDSFVNDPAEYERLRLEEK
jgi:hypothetical protein